MYSISNEDMKKITRLLSRAADGDNPADSTKARNFVRMCRRLSHSLAKKKPAANGDTHAETVVCRKNGESDMTELERALGRLADGSYGVTLTRLLPARTNPQNRYLWGTVYPALLDGLRDAGWEDFLTADDVHAFMKSRYGLQKAVNRHTGEVVEIPASTAKMDTGQFGAYVDKIRDFAQEYLGLYIPEPNGNRKA